MLCSGKLGHGISLLQIHSHLPSVLRTKPSFPDKIWPIFPTPSHLFLSRVYWLTTLVFFLVPSNTPSCFLPAKVWIRSFLYLECSCLHLHAADYFLFFKCQPTCHLSARSFLSTPSKACPLLGLSSIKTYFETSINKKV